MLTASVNYSDTQRRGLFWRDFRVSAAPPAVIPANAGTQIFEMESPVAILSCRHSGQAHEMGAILNPEPVPAKAGIQGFVSAPRTVGRLRCRSPRGGGLPFFARAKKGSRKKARPGAASKRLRFSGKSGSRANSPAAEQRRSGSNTGSLTPIFSLECSAAATGPDVKIVACS